MKILIDFARNRSGFQLIQFPEEIKVDFILADSDRGQETTLHASMETMNKVVLREYGINLALSDKQRK